MSAVATITFDATPSGYRHWSLEVDPPIATLTMQVSADEGLRDDYRLRLNTYDLAVDIELHDAVQRLRFEHPEVKVVVLTGGLDKVFCAGANIQMLAGSSHTHKVNFCRFTNETRNAIEDASAGSGQVWIAARQRHRRRRWVRAGAGVRRDPARRRPIVGRVAPRGAAAGGAPRHRRADPGRRQAPRPARPRRRVRHQGRGGQGATGRRLGTGRRGGTAQRVHRAGPPTSARPGGRLHPSRRRIRDRARGAVADDDR